MVMSSRQRCLECIHASGGYTHISDCVQFNGRMSSFLVFFFVCGLFPSLVKQLVVSISS